MKAGKRQGSWPQEQSYMQKLIPPRSLASLIPCTQADQKPELPEIAFRALDDAKPRMQTDGTSAPVNEMASATEACLGLEWWCSRLVS